MEAILIEIPIFDYDGKTILHNEYYWKIGSFRSEFFPNKKLAMDYIKQFV